LGRSFGAGSPDELPDCAGPYIEPHLITQPILINADEAGSIELSREVLARMLEDFDGICAEELDPVCTE
jgi:hypothetical protein